mgnify:CR=1 FL=1
MELNICHLYPDILNLYGDRGNIITMKRRLESRGISVNVDECSIGQPLDVDKYDIFFIGGGQDFEQEVLLRDLASGKGKVIAAGIWGKLKTITQMIYVPMALLLIPIKALDPAVHPIWQVLTDIMMYISLALTLWSGFCYIWNNREYIKDM